MIQKVYSVLDKVAGAFLPPFFLPNDSVALRAVGDVVNRVGEGFNLHPNDYELHLIGWFDNLTGEISCEDLHNGEGPDGTTGIGYICTLSALYDAGKQLDLTLTNEE